MSVKMINIFQHICSKLEANKDLLNDLDQAIGDGDHGTNMVRGFKAIINEPAKIDNLPINTALANSAMLLLSNIGGSSGPLIGTFLLKLSQLIKDTSNVDDWITALELSFEAVKSRGRSNLGEKTMLDALWPAIVSIKENKSLALDELLIKATKIAYEGAENTKTMLATKGRASYLKERSIGHIDPGAMSVALILEAVSEVS